MVPEVTEQVPSITEGSSSNSSSENASDTVKAPEQVIEDVSEALGGNLTLEDTKATREPLSTPEEEVNEIKTDNETSKRELLFGVDVTEMGLEYPSSRHRVSIEFRKTVKVLEKMIFSVTDSSIQDIAQNLKVGLNKLEDRMANNRRVHMLSPKSDV